MFFIVNVAKCPKKYACNNYFLAVSKVLLISIAKHTLQLKQTASGIIINAKNKVDIKSTSAIPHNILFTISQPYACWPSF
jgi:hypothetical protein